MSEKVQLEKIFLFALCGMFVAFGINIGAYAFLYSSGVLGAVLLVREYVRGNITVSWKFFIPIVFFAYVAITPGHLFKDLPIADMFSAAFFAGAAGCYFFKDKMPSILFLLPLALSAHFLARVVASLAFDYPLIETTGYVGSLTLSYSHHNVVGVLASFGIFSLISFPHPQPTIRRIGYALMAILGIAILLTVGRSTYLGLAAALGLFALLRSWKLAVGGMVVAIAVGAMALPFMAPDAQKRITGMVLAPHKEPNFQNRLPTWSIGIAGFKESPLFGNGLRTFETYSRSYLDKHYLEIKKNNPYALDKAFAHPHNSYIAIIYGWGIVGFIFIFLILALSLSTTKKENKLLILYCTTFILAFGLFDVRFLSRDGALFFLFPIGMAVINSNAILINSLKMK
ncbi:O-antigen ligase family protein [Desulfomicrobium baculatum]|uniref:O-antigen polymerase n=1 Tax=Desulfomicrobium baculatum (strain DSM 4028 / VKM B-1378 / X) TaxID=525897 RepID=C7LP51_DESBD|nr:O-antigen ligase family protein [Desulfomicrobium baculatum]ACU91367.1 O-antigen polymerase [Desulfomicrobium baculatum DSM 4028]